MMRWLTILFLCTMPILVNAQAAPRVSVELPEDKTTVGQPLIVRIKVLVPTFSPKPPEFPTLEAPGLIVRLPERASGPISEVVDGETWSGVQRSYRIYPLAPGTFEVPAQTVRVTYAEPGGITPIVVEIATETIRFEATVPSGAEDLSPLIIADDFRVTQTLDLPNGFEVGDAIERIVKAEIEGTTPILIPQLTPQTESAALRVYPKDPQVSETENRGILSGARVETTTYLAASTGEVILPPIEIKWFSLATNEVREARVDGATLAITGARAKPTAEDIDWRQLVVTVAAIILALWAISKLWPVIKRGLETLWMHWRSSELYASRRVQKAIRERNLNKTFDALRLWSKHFSGLSTTALDADLARVGSASFAAHSETQDASAWRRLSSSFIKLRRECVLKRHSFRDRKSLPPINSVG